MAADHPSLEKAVAGTAITVALGFFAADMFGTSSFEWFREALPQYDTSEIRNYVEFVSVERDGFTVTTGVQFSSSYQRRITDQWCYVMRSRSQAGAPLYRLQLASIDAEGKRSFELLTPTNLAPLGLTEDRARDLITHHCRFR